MNSSVMSITRRFTTTHFFKALLIYPVEVESFSDSIDCSRVFDALAQSIAWLASNPSTVPSPGRARRLVQK